MSKVFIGGSRHVSRLASEVKDRLNKVISAEHDVLLGDANGVDKAVQKHLAESQYERVTIFCSGDQPRNNIGGWRTHHVQPSKRVKGFQFYAAKDREMAVDADFGLMIWDGKSAGTILNLLRLAKLGKKAVLYDTHARRVLSVSPEEWFSIFDSFSDDLKVDVRQRATSEEWDFQSSGTQRVLNLETSEPAATEGAESIDAVSRRLNRALACADSKALLKVLVDYERSRGEKTLEGETASKKLLDIAFSNRDEVDFTAVVRLISGLGFQLTVTPADIP